MPPGRPLVIRHDVDRWPGTALDMARVERECGLRASYYFRRPATWQPETIKAVAALGHEVGLHYESLDKAGGDPERAAKSLASDLEFCRRLVTIETVSMHGNPFSPHDNRDLWRSCRLEDFGLSGEAYLSMDFSRLLYYSDTGRIWLDERYNLKDHVPAQHGQRPGQARGPHHA